MGLKVQILTQMLSPWSRFEGDVSLSRYSWQTALSYIAIILSCYFMGMTLLLMHYINRRSITLYDFYLEAYTWCKTAKDEDQTAANGDSSRQNNSQYSCGAEEATSLAASQPSLPTSSQGMQKIPLTNKRCTLLTEDTCSEITSWDDFSGFSRLSSA